MEGADEGPDRIKILLQVVQRFEDLLVGSASEPTLQLGALQAFDGFEGDPGMGVLFHFYLP